MQDAGNEQNRIRTRWPRIVLEIVISSRYGAAFYKGGNMRKIYLSFVLVASVLHVGARAEEASAPGLFCDNGKWTEISVDETSTIKTAPTGKTTPDIILKASDIRYRQTATSLDFCVHAKLTMGKVVVYEKEIMIPYAPEKQRRSINFGTYKYSDKLVFQGLTIALAVLPDPSNVNEFALESTLAFLDAKPGQTKIAYRYFSR